MNNGKRNAFWIVVAAGITLLVFAIGNAYSVANRAQNEVQEIREAVAENNKNIAVLQGETLIRLKGIEEDVREIKDKLDERWKEKR